MDAGKLIRRAADAAAKAYAPYSGFCVGAVLATAEGKIFAGANIENASYGVSICAERVALFKAVIEGEREFAVLAVAHSGGEDTQPCGACLQALSEFSDDLTVIFHSGGDVAVRNLDELLTEPFKGRRKGS